MKTYHLAVLGMVIAAIVAVSLSAAWARDMSRAERALATPIEPMLSTPVSLTASYRVNCASASATNLLIPMDGGPVGGIGPVSTIYVSPCDPDVDAGDTCITTRDVRVGPSTVGVSTGLQIGATGRDGTGLSMDAKGGWCAGIGGAQQVDVVVGRN